MNTLLTGGTIVTCDQADTVLEADLLISGGQIRGIFRRDASAKERAEARRASTPAKVLDVRGMAIIPGFVQAHVHLCQVLFRGMADDMPLLEWLKTRIWPLEAAHDEASLRASAELGLAEMMRAGTTMILDMGTVRAHDAVMDACVRSGIRAASGKTMMDLGEGVPDGLRESTQSSLDESERLEKTWAGKGNGRISYAYAPRFVLSCSEALFRGVAERARASGAIVHTHAAEHPGELEAVRAVYGNGDVDVLRSWGIYGPRTVLAHGVQLTDAQAKIIAEDGTRIVHCPSANLKLGSGIARIAELDAFGVKLALGADGAPCNNNLDPWVELRHAALLAKIRTGVTTIAARRALRLATIDGANALGVGDVTGSIELGKRADLAAVRIDDLHVEPGGDVFSRLVYGCQSRDVRHVFCDGALVVKDGEHTLLDAPSVLKVAREQAKKLAARADIR